ncbi:hypothetical protein PGTUg99_036689 [Puccinia graminis f. sp. tritici]|uniref:Uncharacterized protein n=1 Tax=Puccinia graminis f. sp. tritici TaxID=56615 RepID=A0A5B0RAI9_PUCGR|nr:hypothetical protein PGTUg99_036689 [Puccinia graminis f. sp. tritici]
MGSSMGETPPSWRLTHPSMTGFDRSSMGETPPSRTGFDRSLMEVNTPIDDRF